MKISHQLRIALSITVLMLAFGLSAMAQLGKLHGKVTQDGVSIAGATVELYFDGRFAGQGAITGEKGEYEFSKLSPGEYTIVVKIDGKEQTLSASVSPDGSQVLDVAMEDNNGETPRILPGLEIYGEHLVLKTDREVSEINRRDLGHLPVERGDINSIIASIGAPVVQKDHGDPLMFKGARDNANVTYFDGMKIRGSDEIPMGAIEQLSVMSGGVPAEYGDALGAVVVVTTRNPSMTMYSVGKPRTKAEKRQERKHGKSGAAADAELTDLASL